MFAAKGRDGKTDIWGVIVRPTNFDPTKKYPGHREHLRRAAGLLRAEDVQRTQTRHAGAGRTRLHRRADRRHGHGNRRRRFTTSRGRTWATPGFPDRILWHKAVAAKYPYYDITRVGIYGTSAGGQNALGGLLFHPEFYKAAVSSAGLPRQPHGQDLVERAVDGLADRPAVRGVVQRGPRARSCRASCCSSSARWTRNVDPVSTMQVVNALIKANKDFDLLVIPNADHTNGGAYGDHKRFDFFVRFLQGVSRRRGTRRPSRRETPRVSAYSTSARWNGSPARTGDSTTSRNL